MIFTRNTIVSLLWLTFFIVYTWKYRNNIDSLEQSRESRYLLNDYIAREKKKISINGMEYEVTLYQGDHSNEYLLSEMKEGKVEGRCQLFNRGILSLAWMMKNGKRVGGVTEYENGKAISQEGWDSLLGNDGEDRRIIENSKEGLIMTIRRKGKEENEDGCVIYRGGFDEEMNRDGYGIEYDVDNGKEKIEGYWSKDKLIRMIREFDADNNQMIEYAECSEDNVEILNRVPIYIGGYSIENDKYVRNGKGYVIINGRQAPYVGNICMDVCMIDVTGIDCKEGDSVEIFGDHLPVTVLSDALETIPYEVLTSVSTRVKRVYYQD